MRVCAKVGTGVEIKGVVITGTDSIPKDAESTNITAESEVSGAELENVSGGVYGEDPAMTATTHSEASCVP